MFFKEIFKIYLGENSKALLKDTKADLDKQQDVFYSNKEEV